MDFGSDISVKHAVVNAIKITHVIEFAPSTIDMMKEIRYSVVVIVVGWSAVEIFRTFIGNRKSR